MGMNLFLRYEQTAVAIAEETEIVVEGVAVDILPSVAAHKSRDQQKQRGLRLVEVGDHATHDVIMIAWCDDDLGGGVEGIRVVAIHPVEDGGEGGE